MVPLREFGGCGGFIGFFVLLGSARAPGTERGVNCVFLLIWCGRVLSVSL